MKRYPFADVEPKWQAYWERHATFRTRETPGRPKFYCLDMFPYPSGSGLHVGHLEGYTATDIVSRYKRMRGFNVLHPMGWDAFGLPAEQYAVKTGIHPAITTAENVATFRRQMKRAGLSYDWEREIDTTDPRYYRWTQWIFLKLFERGLAYVAEVPVNWCPGARHGAGERGDRRRTRARSEASTVVRAPMRQWVLKITAYADRLLDDLAVGRLANQHAGDAEELDRPLDRRRGRVRGRRRERAAAHLHHASRHAVRRHLHGAGARAPAGGGGHRGGTARRGRAPIAKRPRARATCHGRKRR